MFIPRIILIFLLIFGQINYAQALGWKELKDAGSFTLSGIPCWWQAYHYANLLSQNRAISFFGKLDAEEHEELFIKDTLKNLNFANWQDIKIKLISEDKRDYVLSAMICTDNVMFINPVFYDGLLQVEKKAVIARAANLMKNKHTLVNSIFFAILPIFTHCGTELYAKCVDSLFQMLPDSIKTNSLASNLIKLHSYISTCWITKFAVNCMFGAQYFKYKTMLNDIRASKSSHTALDLLNYYVKMDGKTKENNALLSACQPGIERQIHYLSSIIKDQAETDNRKSLLFL